MIRNFGTRIGSEGRVSRAFPGSGSWVSGQAGLGEVCRKVDRARTSPAWGPSAERVRLNKYDGADGPCRWRLCFFAAGLLLVAVVAFGLLLLPVVG